MFWLHDRAYPISWKEYDYWMTHKLPGGCAILSPPTGERPKPSWWQKLLSVICG